VTLSCHGVSTAVGPERRRLFSDLDATFAPGLTAVVGPNGAGKTTLLRTLAGLAVPDAGEVRLHDEPIAAVDRKRRAKTLAYLPQSTALSQDLDVLALVMLGRLPYLPRLGGPSAHDQARVQAAMASVGVADLAGRRLSSLSGGERQRVMLARMLATEAKVLVLDEPTTALDVRHSLDVLMLCHRLGDEERTVIVSLHDLPLARRYAARALCLCGDAAGTVHVGEATRVLDPAVLSDVFGVPMRIRNGDLVVAPHADSGMR
jgi:iron complex transport system ATP-binding protein